MFRCTLNIIKKVKYKDWNCNLVQSHYQDGGRIALVLIDADDGEPVATATINLPSQPLLENEVFIKDYSENAGMADFLEKEGVLEKTGRSVRTGFVHVPVCRLKNG